MSWRDSEDAKGCDMHQALYRDDGELLGMVLRLHGGEDTYAYTVTPIGLRRLGACWSDDTARRAVERAVGTEEGVLWLERVPGSRSAPT
jgi:hypothetical protein